MGWTATTQERNSSKMHSLWLAPPLLALMAQPLSGTADEQAVGPNLTDAETEILALEEDRNERFTIPVTIDGAGPFKFMIDTGSQATAVTDVVHERLSLASAGTAIVVGTASRKQVEMVEVDELGFGSRTIYGLEAPVLQRAHVGADGIIGLDSLQNMRVLIDFRDETIAIADSDDKSSRRGYEIIVRARQKLGQLLVTNAEVDGVRATVIIDTGAQGSLANLALRDRLRKRRAQDVRTMDVNGVSMIGKLSYARDVTLQGITFHDIPITYADTPAFEALGLQDTPVLSIGMQHLRMFDRVAIDFSKRRILFDIPGRHRFRSRL